MENTFKTYLSNVSPVRASNRADENIKAMNEDGWETIQFTTYTVSRLIQGNLRDYHHVSVLFKKE